MEFILGIIIAYFAFLFLDALFRPRRPPPPNIVNVRGNNKRIAIQDVNGDWYICEERDTAELSPDVEVPEKKGPDLRVVE